MYTLYPISNIRLYIYYTDDTHVEKWKELVGRRMPAFRSNRSWIQTSWWMLVAKGFTEFVAPYISKISQTG